MTRTRAAKGGQYGVNGEHYDGGQFLPTSAGTVKGMFKSGKVNATRKIEIEPYIWAVPPTADSRSLYRNLAGTFCKMVNGKMAIAAPDAVFTYYKMTRQQVQDMADRYNAGERWF